MRLQIQQIVLLSFALQQLSPLGVYADLKSPTGTNTCRYDHLALHVTVAIEVIVGLHVSIPCCWPFDVLRDNKTCALHHEQGTPPHDAVL